MFKNLLLAASLLVGASASHAATVVNLSAGPFTANAGPDSGLYPYNPVVVKLAPGFYSVGVTGIAGGGLYDAYSVYAPSPSNGAYTDSQWSVSPAGGTVQKEASIGRFDTASAALAAYSALAPLTFTLTAPTKVSFFLDDSAFPYFFDDEGGVSLAVAAPEPGSLALIGAGLAGIGLIRMRRVAG